jgi:hypothetical protein
VGKIPCLHHENPGKKNTPMNIFCSIIALMLIAGDVPAHVSYLMGTASVERGGVRYRAVLNAPLQVNDIVTTGDDSECEITFGRYSLLHLGANSSVRIERKEETKQGVFHRIFASLGEIVTKVVSLSKDDEYEMRTEAAQAFIRGTTFKTSIDEDGTSSFSVFEGKIAVKSVLEGAREILLDTHFSSQIEKGQLAPVVEKLSDLEISAFRDQFSDFLRKGEVLDSLRNTFDEKIEDKKDDIKNKAKDKLEGLFK